jgi:hypothetical protein
VLRGQLVHETTLSVGTISQICGIGWGRTGPQLFVNVYRQSPYLPATPEVWDLMRGTMLAAPALPALQLHRATWSPTGQHLVAIGERVAWVLESASGTVVDMIESPVVWGAAFAWSPDGNQLLLTGRWQGELPLLTQVIDPALLRAELTRRVGECGRSPFRMIEPEPRTLEDHIRQYIPDWRGIEIELSVVADLLARYDRIAAS